MKNQEIKNVIFTAIDIDTLIEKIAKKVVLIIESNIENHNQQSEFKDLLNTSLMSLDISVRAYNNCKNANIKTLGELASWKISELRKLRNFGMRSEYELTELLAKNRLSFGMNLSKYNIK